MLDKIVNQWLVWKLSLLESYNLKEYALYM